MLNTLNKIVFAAIQGPDSTVAVPKNPFIRKWAWPSATRATALWAQSTSLSPGTI